MKKLILFIIIIATYSSLAQNNKYILRTNNIIDLTEYASEEYLKQFRLIWSNGLDIVEKTEIDNYVQKIVSKFK